MTPREAFKAGFLARCTADGLLTAGAIRGAVKTADDKLAGLTGDLLQNVVRPVLDTGRSWGLPAAVFGPILAGGAGGLALSKATDLSDEDVKAIRDRELMETYRLETEKLRRRRAVRDYHQAKINAPTRMRF